MRSRCDFKKLLLLLLIVSGVLAVSGCLRRPDEELDELRYQAPVTLTIKPGEYVPGTNIRYLGLTDDRAEFLIEGKKAVKSKGDSLDWRGTPVEGADVDLNLRVAWYDSETVRVIGTAKVIVDRPVPQAVNVPESTLMTYHAPVAYGMAPGALVP